MAQSSGSESWRVGRRGGQCAACASAFVPGRDAVSALYRESADAGRSEDQPTFLRRDFCGPCFEDAAKRGSPYSWWSAVVPEPDAKKAVFDLGVAKEFFQRLVGDPSPEHGSLRYLLALMLLRKRAIHLEGQENRPGGALAAGGSGPGVEVLTIRIPPDDETLHEIEAAEIDEAEAERLRDQLGRLFQLA